MHNYIGLKCLRKPSFFSLWLMFTKFSSKISNILAIIFVLLFTFWRSSSYNELKNIVFFLFFLFFLQFLKFPSVKICTGETLSIPYFLKILLSKLFLMLKNDIYLLTFKKNLFDRNYWKNRIGKVYILCLELYNIFKKFNEGNARYLHSFLAIFTHVTAYFFPIIN